MSERCISDLIILRDDALEDGLGMTAMWLNRAIGTLERVSALAAEWETAAEKPMPTKAEGESERDQGVRIGVWHSVKTAAAELRKALEG